MRFQCPAVSARLLRSRSASASERAPIACLRIRMRSHSTSVRSEATTRSSALAPLLVEKPLELGGLEPPRHAPVESWVVAGPKRHQTAPRQIGQASLGLGARPAAGRQKLGDHLAAVGDLDVVPRPYLPHVTAEVILQLPEADLSHIAASRPPPGLRPCRSTPHFAPAVGCRRWLARTRVSRGSKRRQVSAP